MSEYFSTNAGEPQHSKTVMLMCAFFFCGRCRVASVIIYVAAFACSIPVTNGHAREVGLFGLVPWHKVQVWGLHEDFHALLLLADICVACIGVRLLTNPDLDHILVQ